MVRSIIRRCAKNVSFFHSFCTSAREFVVCGHLRPYPSRRFGVQSVLISATAPTIIQSTNASSFCGVLNRRNVRVQCEQFCLYTRRSVITEQNHNSYFTRTFNVYMTLIFAN
uniref:Uncharacterized protein n=1 Tax=Anopheles minimus TaxID=112268 RepID=A0A182WQF9_9DIPT